MKTAVMRDWQSAKNGITIEKGEREMRRAIIITIIMLAVSAEMFGQIRMNNDRRVLVSKRVSMGVKIGAADAVMEFTNEQLKNLTRSRVIHPVGGIYVELPVTRFFSVSPELMFMQRGTTVSYKWSGHTTDYRLDSRSIDLRVPLQFYWVATNVFKPYVFVGPDLSYVIGGKISQEQPGGEMGNNEIEIGEANMNKYDVSLLAGVGFRFDINMDKRYLYVKIEAAYNHGFLNTYSQREMDDASHSVNVSAYNVTGKRYNRSFEVMISVGMPFYKKGETCSYFGKRRMWW